VCFTTAFLLAKKLYFTLIGTLILKNILCNIQLVFNLLVQDSFLGFTFVWFVVVNLFLYFFIKPIDSLPTYFIGKGKESKAINFFINIRKMGLNFFGQKLSFFFKGKFNNSFLS
jgi:hypothetical protein